jgi:hypothetical protein
MTIKARFAQFTKIIRPTDKHIEEADRQTDFMIGRLKHRVSSDENYELERIVLAGSNAKHTSLRKTEQNRFNVDLNACFSGKGATKEKLDKLLHFTRDQLADIYRHLKDEKDFEILKSAVRVKFCNLGSDGMTIDQEGNVYLTGQGVTVFDKTGKQIEHVPVPEPWTANVCFGGKDKQTLFITASKSLYSLNMRVKGAGSQ